MTQHPTQTAAYGAAMRRQKMIHKGFAVGGIDAAREAVALWATCAMGGERHAPSVIAARDALHFVMRPTWVPLPVVAAAAQALLDACAEAAEHRGVHPAVAGVVVLEDGSINLTWEGSWTRGRRITVTLAYEVPAEGDGIDCSLNWATGIPAHEQRHSEALNLPRMTDEADLPSRHRRPYGWTARYEHDCWPERPAEIDAAA